MKIPTSRDGDKFLTFELKELGIDAFMAVKTMIEKNKWKEAFLLFLRETRIGGDDVDKLKSEFDSNNLIPFNSCMNIIPQILEPVPGELKKN